MNVRDVEYIILDLILKRKRKHLDRRVNSSRGRNRVSIIKIYLRICKTYNQTSKEKEIPFLNEHNRN